MGWSTKVGSTKCTRRNEEIRNWVRPICGTHTLSLLNVSLLLLPFSKSTKLGSAKCVGLPNWDRPDGVVVDQSVILRINAGDEIRKNEIEVVEFVAHAKKSIKKLLRSCLLLACLLLRSYAKSVLLTNNQSQIELYLQRRRQNLYIVGLYILYYSSSTVVAYYFRFYMHYTIVVVTSRPIILLRWTSLLYHSIFA